MKESNPTARADELIRQLCVGRGLDEFEGPARAIIKLVEESRGDLSPPAEARAVGAGTFILDEPEHVQAIWGDSENAAWTPGEPLLLVGAPGVGKTTLLGALCIRREGFVDGELLGMPVRPSAGRGLYFAADRPRQIARSLRRQVRDVEREALELGLLIHRGPPPFDLGKGERGQLLEFVRQFPEIDTVYLDSLKDLAVGLSEDAIGAAVNAELQALVADGIEVVATHHQRKATADNRKPRTLDDVYGSTWLTSGAGSVILLWGAAGDPFIELRHIKQPVGEVGPLTVAIDHARGELTVHEGADLVTLVGGALNGGLTVKQAATEMYGCNEPDRSQIEAARRRLEALVGEAKAVRIAGNPVHYRCQSGVTP